MSHEEREVGLPAADEEGLGRLLRLAGPRPAVPEERAARVKTTVRSRWLAEVRARKARTRWSLGVLAAAATVAVALGVSVRRPAPAVPPAPAEPVARLEAASGSPAQWLGPGATDPSRLGVGRSLVAGSTVLTGAQGRAALRLASGASLRLDLGTRLQLLARDALVLESGALYVDDGTVAGGGASIQVRTPFGVARDLGTQFEVRLGASSLRLRVREGRVILQRGNSIEAADVGTELTVDARGGVARARVAAHDEGWDWVVGLAPAYEIEGRSLLDFLGWVSRETGWVVDFASREVEESAQDVVLHGSVEGLGPREAAAAVLPTCGLAHTVDRGIMRITALGDGK